LEDLGIDERIISEWFLEKSCEGGGGCVCGVDPFGSGFGPVAGSYENNNEPSVFANGGELYD
jgi:hypothetical protein